MDKLLQKIFSVKNEDCHKVWTFCGIKCKFKNKQKFIINEAQEVKNSLVLLHKDNTRLVSSINDNSKKINSYIQQVNNNINSVKSGLGIQGKKADINNDEILNISEQKEIVMIDKCPYCNSSKIYPIRDFPFSKLIKEYIDRFKFNPYSEIYNDLTLTKMHCFDCDLEFYNYEIPDTPLLYEKLLESGNYIYPKYKWEYVQAIDLIKKYNLKKVLDIGCGEGHFLDKISTLVDFAMGCEFNKTALERCQSKNLNVTDKTLDNISEKFDFICMFQILEHINTPKEFLNDVLNLLIPNGILFIVTPNPYGGWCRSENPSVLNLPPHHCLDVTKEFYYNLEKDLPLKLLDYRYDEISFGVYSRYVVKNIVKIPDNKYISYLIEKDNMPGHNHGVVYQKIS